MFLNDAQELQNMFDLGPRTVANNFSPQCMETYFSLQISFSVILSCHYYTLTMAKIPIRENNCSFLNNYHEHAKKSFFKKAVSPRVGLKKKKIRGLQDEKLANRGVETIAQNSTTKP